MRGEERQVSQAWVDQYRRKLGDNMLVVGDEPQHVDTLGDGLPDSGWRKAQIETWLKSYGVAVPGGYKTKTSLLSMVYMVLSPAAEEEIEPEPLEEEVVDEILEEVVEVITEEEVDSVIEEN